MKQKFDIYTIKKRQTDLICQSLEVWNFQHISQCWAQQAVKANHITYLSFEETMQPLCFMAPLSPYTLCLKCLSNNAYQWLFSLWHLHQCVANKKSRKVCLKGIKYHSTTCHWKKGHLETSCTYSTHAAFLPHLTFIWKVRGAWRSWESLGLQRDPTSPFWRRSVLGFLWREWCWIETPVLWPPHAKSWLIGKDSDAGRDWGQEEKGRTEDEVAGWHHWLDGRESEWTLGVGDGQGGLACCDSWDHKQSDMTEQLNWTEGQCLF